MGPRDLDRWDFLIVMAILATLTVTLRLSSQREESAPNPLPSNKTDYGMETVWRDALSDRRDVRPVGDPDMIWEEPKDPPAARFADAPKAEARSEPAAEPEPYFPKPIQVSEPAAPALRMAPMRDTLLNDSGSGANTSAFLPVPEPPKRETRPPARTEAAAKASAPPQGSPRFWRRSDGR